MILEALIEFFYPKRCGGCGKIGVWLCERCRSSLELSEQICPGCGGESITGETDRICRRNTALDGLTVIFDYRDEKVKKVIESIKFGFNRDMVEELMREIEPNLGRSFDGLVPLPLDRYRENWRGFNQAKAISEVWSRKLGLPVVDVLKRKRRVKQQSTLDREERMENMKGVFELRNMMDVDGKRYLLVDDVFTTGSSMNAAAKVMKRAGVSYIWGLALAH